MVNSSTIKGFRDYLGSDASKRVIIKRIIQDNLERYGFEPADTPIIESEEFVVGDNKADEAVRDVFRLQDRGERKLALRYEFTFQLKRIAKNQKLPYKRYQIGEVFRDEPIREGRTRQFVQCDADVIGSTIKDEAELLSLTKETYDALQIPIKIFVNNRKLINEIMVEEKIDEKVRAQAIREIDKLDKLSKKEVADNLKKLGAERLVNLFDKEESYYEKYKMYAEIKQLKKYCKDFGVEVIFRPFLARGLAYYNSSVFEVWSEKLNASLSGGGSYLIDGIQATGISFGLEPIMLLSPLQGRSVDAVLISLNQDKEAVVLTQKLRENNLRINLLMDKNIMKALEYAHSKSIPFVIILGKEEVDSKKIKLKNMIKGTEELLSEKEVIKRLTP